MLMGHIRDTLPEIRKRISGMVVDNRVELDELGDEVVFDNKHSQVRCYPSACLHLLLPQCLSTPSLSCMTDGVDVIYLNGLICYDPSSCLPPLSSLGLDGWSWSYLSGLSY